MRRVPPVSVCSYFCRLHYSRAKCASDVTRSSKPASKLRDPHRPLGLIVGLVWPALTAPCAAATAHAEAGQQPDPLPNAAPRFGTHRRRGPVDVD